MDLASLLTALSEHGLLLVQDPRLPSVAALVAGEPVKGSWWGHPASHAIFARLGALHDHPDVLRTKLVAGKVTLLHRRLWSAFYAVGTARERWQLDALDGEARALLATVDRDGAALASGASAKALERALLVHAGEVHTPSGAHATELRRWSDWPPAATLPAIPVDAAKAALEAQLEALNRRFGARAQLPWPRTTGRR